MLRFNFLEGEFCIIGCERSPRSRISNDKSSMRWPMQPLRPCASRSSMGQWLLVPPCLMAGFITCLIITKHLLGNLEEVGFGVWRGVSTTIYCSINSQGRTCIAIAFGVVGDDFHYPDIAKALIS